MDAERLNLLQIDFDFDRFFFLPTLIPECGAISME